MFTLKFKELMERLSPSESWLWNELDTCHTFTLPTQCPQNIKCRLYVCIRKCESLSATCSRWLQLNGKLEILTIDLVVHKLVQMCSRERVLTSLFTTQSELVLYTPKQGFNIMPWTFFFFFYQIQHKVRTEQINIYSVVKGFLKFLK